MVTVGAQGTTVSGVNATFTLNGNLYAAVTNFTAKWGNELEEEKVGGTDIPIVITSAYHGEIDMTVVYSTENAASEQFTKLIDPSTSNNAISAITLVWTGKDPAGTTRTFTFASKFYPKQTEWSQVGTGAVKAKITGILTARPTLS